MIKCHPYKTMYCIVKAKLFYKQNVRIKMCYIQFAINGIQSNFVVQNMLIFINVFLKF